MSFVKTDIINKNTDAEIARVLEMLKSQGSVTVNAIKKVQRGITTGAYGKYAKIVEIEEVNPEKTFIHFVPVVLTVENSVYYPYGSGGDRSAEASVILTSSHTISVSTNFLNTTANVAWEVIEFY